MIIVSYVCACLIALLAILFVILKVTKLKTFANNSALFIGAAFIVGVVMFGFFYASTYDGISVVEEVFKSFYSGIKMFALGNDEKVFLDTGNEAIKIVYPVIFGTDTKILSEILIRYVAQISALVIVSGAIISTVWRSISFGFHNLKVWMFHAFSPNKKSYTKNIVYTDLDYEHIRPFLENLQNDKKAINTVVILKKSASTQHGQELAEIIKIQGIKVENESLDFRAIKKFCLFGGSWKINFYSLFEDDIDNLAFGDIALQFYLQCVKEKGDKYKGFIENKKRKNAKTCEDLLLTISTLEKELEEYKQGLDLSKLTEDEQKELENSNKKINSLKNDLAKFQNAKIEKRLDKYDVDFYISFQNESFNNKTNFLRLSNGHIKLVSEYDTVATRFVFENPLTRFVYASKVDLRKSLMISKNINVHFIGFGRINQAIAAKMLPNYQMPNDDIQVNYHIATEGASEKTITEFLARFPALNSVYNEKSKNKNAPEFLSQRKVSNFFHEHNLNALNDDQLYSYANDIVELTEAAKPEDGEPMNVIIIALGNSQTNVDIAIKLRTDISHVLAYKGLKAKREDGHPKIVIYPYVKDNNFFKQSPDLFVNSTTSILEDINSNKNLKTDAEREEYRRKVIEDKDLYFKKYEDYIKNKNKSYYNNDLAFVFETNYAKDVGLPKNKRLEELHINKSDWYKLYDKFHDVSFRYEKLPIINFGRGGYLADPSYEAIVDLAKYVNRYFCKIDNDYDMEEAWKNLNYINQQSNIGTVLSFPTKAGILGFKLIFDKSGKFDDYVYKHNQDLLNKKYRNKKGYKETACLLESCYDRYLASCEYLSKAKAEDEYDVLKEAAGFTLDLDKAIQNNPELVKAQLNGLKVEGELSVKSIKEAFIKKYEATYKEYKAYAEEGFKITQNGSLTDEEKEEQINELAKGHEEIIGKMKTLLLDYFNIVYRSLLTDDFKVIRNTEHNRWYMDKTYFGVVPRDVNKVRYLYGHNKSKDTLRHLCMTTNENLDVLGNLCIEKIAKAGFYIVSEPIDNKPSLKTYNYIPESLNELKFNAKDSKDSDPLLYSIFYTSYYSDVFQYVVLMDYIVDDYIEMKLPKHQRRKFNFMLRFYNSDLLDKKSKELEIILEKKKNEATAKEGE